MCKFTTSFDVFRNVFRNVFREPPAWRPKPAGRRPAEGCLKRPPLPSGATAAQSLPNSQPPSSHPIAAQSPSNRCLTAAPLPPNRRRPLASGQPARRPAATGSRCRTAQSPPNRHHIAVQSMPNPLPSYHAQRVAERRSLRPCRSQATLSDLRIRFSLELHRTVEYRLSTVLLGTHLY